MLILVQQQLNTFHGSGISLFRHSRQPDDGTSRGRFILGGAGGTKKFGALPNYYTNVPHVQASENESPVPDRPKVWPRRKRPVTINGLSM